VTGRDERVPGILTDCDADLALDALLAGRDPGDDLRVLTTLAEDLRVATGGPAPPPSPELAVLMLGAARPRSATRHPGPARRRTRSWAARTSARVAGLGLVAKATLGGAVAVAGVASAGAAGLLPAAVVDRVWPVVEAVTPFRLDTGRTPDDERDRGGAGRPAEPGSDPPPAAVGSDPPPAAVGSDPAPAAVEGDTLAGGPVTTDPTTSDPATSARPPSAAGPEASDPARRTSSSAPADGSFDDAAVASGPAGSAPPPAPAGGPPTHPPGGAGPAGTGGGQTPGPDHTGPPPGSSPASSGERPGEPGGEGATGPSAQPGPTGQPGPPSQPDPTGQPGPTGQDGTSGQPGPPPGEGPPDHGDPNGGPNRGPAGQGDGSSP
jgi:hypothetical protein